MDKRVIGFVCFLIAILVIPSVFVLIYNLGYYANALSSVVIATATVIYATLTYLLLREQRREKEKPRIQEITEVVILPQVKRLESQKRYLGKGDFGWIQSGYVGNITKLEFPFLWGMEKLIYDDFKKVYPKVANKIEEHDKGVEKLKENLKEFADKIKSQPDFKNKVSERFMGYRRREKPENVSYFELTARNFGYILELIVNNEQELSRDVYREFWSLYGGEFLSFREREEVKECKAEVEKGRKNLLDFEDSILKDLMGILKRFREEHGIIYKGIEAKENSRLLP
jgi:hypothetical protein